MEPLRNKKAYFNYQILETFEAGLKLLGFEVKAIKSGRVSFEGSYISFRGQEAYWVNATIPPYQPLNTPKNYDEKRPRKILLNQDELKTLYGRSQEKGLTVVPLKVYIKNGVLKLEIGVARTKKKWDKRETIKKRDIEREVRRGE